MVKRAMCAAARCGQGKSTHTPHVCRDACPPFNALASPAVAHFTLSDFAGVWYELESSSIEMTDTCHCTRYNISVELDGGWRDQFECRKDSPRSARTLVPSRGHASSDERFPGRMSATFFHSLSSPFWVLDVFSDTQNGAWQYALVYACVSPRGIKSEYVWLLSRTPDITEAARSHFVEYCANREYLRCPLHISRPLLPWLPRAPQPFQWQSRACTVWKRFHDVSRTHP